MHAMHATHAARASSVHATQRRAAPRRVPCRNETRHDACKIYGPASWCPRDAARHNTSDVTPRNATPPTTPCDATPRDATRCHPTDLACVRTRVCARACGYMFEYMRARCARTHVACMRALRCSAVLCVCARCICDALRCVALRCIALRPCVLRPSVRCIAVQCVAMCCIRALYVRACVAVRCAALWCGVLRWACTLVARAADLVDLRACLGAVRHRCDRLHSCSVSAHRRASVRVRAHACVCATCPPPAL